MGNDARATDDTARLFAGGTSSSLGSGKCPRGDQLIVDNTAWVDLVERGFPARNVVWFWKLDLDPGVSDLYPGGYRAFDYVLSSDIMRASEQAPVRRLRSSTRVWLRPLKWRDPRRGAKFGGAKKTRCGDAKP